MSKYNRTIIGRDIHGEVAKVVVDVYDVLKAFEVTDPALQHLIKKALCAGLRGHKTLQQDLLDIQSSAMRAAAMHFDAASIEKKEQE